MRLTRPFSCRVGNCSVTAVHGTGSARAAKGHYSAPRGRGHRRDGPRVPGEAERVGRCFCSPSEGPRGWKANHRYGQRTTFLLRGEKGAVLQEAQRPHGVPAPFWGWQQAPRPGSFLLFLTRHGLSQKNDAPCACSYWLCPEPAHELPAAAGIIRGDKSHFPTRSRARAIETAANIPTQRYRVKKTQPLNPNPSNLKHCIGVALKTT